MRWSVLAASIAAASGWWLQSVAHHRDDGVVPQRALHGRVAARAAVTVVPHVHHWHRELAPGQQLVDLVVGIGNRRVDPCGRRVAHAGGELLREAHALRVGGNALFHVHDSAVADHARGWDALQLEGEGGVVRTGRT